MQDCLIERYLESVCNSGSKTYRVRLCKMVTWLDFNFKQIQSGEITYQDYDKKASELGITTYIEEIFNDFKNQDTA